MEPTLAQSGLLLVQVAMGVSLAACAGLRAFLPLFVVGVAGRFEVIPLSSSFEWLTTWPSIVVLGIAVMTEILGDKFPVVDNFLDVLQTFVKPIAGTILMVAVLTELTPLQATVFGIIAGGGMAEAVHLTKAKTRVVSTVTTAGLGNPLVSFGEDAAAFGGSLIALFWPVIFAALVLLGLVAFWVFLRQMLRGRRAAHP